MTRSQFIETLNLWGAERIPFLFIIDFEFNKPLAFRLHEIDPDVLLFDVKGFSNLPVQKPALKHIEITKKEPLSIEEYGTKFELIYKHLALGDSYLTNLTTKTKVELNASLKQVFFNCQAPYKLLYKDEFLVFSPESFVVMKQGKIFSYPMKGTIDAETPDAKNIILNDTKELAEHVTIVDLIRNDLSLVSNNVKVTRFRYVDEIKTDYKNLFQVSSEIEGSLPEDYLSNLGSILAALLPAGSVSGAPKAKTTQIIADAEKADRGYYTGIFGYFNGTELDSGVMIRYIERENDTLYYRSGGGITTQSNIMNEYTELVNKIYIPLLQV